MSGSAPGATWQRAEMVSALPRPAQADDPDARRAGAAGRDAARPPSARDRALPRPRLRATARCPSSCSPIAPAPRPCSSTSPSRCSRGAAQRLDGASLEARARRPVGPGLALGPPRRRLRRRRLLARDPPPAKRAQARAVRRAVRAARAGRDVRQPRLRARRRSPPRPVRRADGRQRRARRARARRRARGPTRFDISSQTTASATKTCPTPPRTRFSGSPTPVSSGAELHFKWAEAAVFGGCKPYRR